MLNLMKGADLLRGIATIASAVSAHGHMHEFLIHVLSHVRLEEGGTANSHGRDGSVAGPAYSQEDLDAALDAIDALAKCVKCPTELFDDFVRDITSHATRSPCKLSGWQKSFPDTPPSPRWLLSLPAMGRPTPSRQRRRCLSRLRGSRRTSMSSAAFPESSRPHSPSSPAAWRCSTECPSTSTRNSRRLRRPRAVFGRGVGHQQGDVPVGHGVFLQGLRGLSRRSSSAHTSPLKRQSRLTRPDNSSLVR